MLQKTFDKKFQKLEESYHTAINLRIHASLRTIRGQSQKSNYEQALFAALFAQCVFYAKTFIRIKRDKQKVSKRKFRILETNISTKKVQTESYMID